MKISEEIIDSFLRGDLSIADTEAFTNALSADPKLQQEVSIQQDIVNTLKAHRHQQLKNRLNSIDVKPGGLLVSSYVKLAASIGLVALLVSTFMLFSRDKDEAAVLKTEQNEFPELKKSQATVNSEKASKAPSTDNNAVANNQEPASNNTGSALKPVSKNSVQKKHTAANVTYSEMDTEEMDEQFNIHPQTDGVDLSTISHSSVSSSTSQIKVNIVKDNDLAYRFFNNQLYLHGNFSNSPYELYELNNSPSKQLFLYFEGSYYELIQGKTKVTPLTPIKDKATLVQLSQLKAH